MVFLPNSVNCCHSVHAHGNFNVHTTRTVHLRGDWSLSKGNIANNDDLSSLKIYFTFKTQIIKWCTENKWLK